MNLQFLKRAFLFVITVLFVFGLSGCLSASSSSGNTGTESASSSDEYAGRKILWVDSYHQGYEWSDGIESGIRAGLEGTGIELKVFRMDTKQNPAGCEQAGRQAFQEIQAFQPDVVIATDDNAQKCLVVPYLKGTDLPVIFAGVNWDASVYGYPASNVTGMVEVELVEQLIELVSPYAKGSRIAYLSIETETEIKISDAYNTRFFNGQMATYWAKTQTEFKDAFLEAQQETDILYISNNAGAPDWNEEEMKRFIAANTRVPTIAVNPWMSPYVLATLAKVPEEQGQSAAEMALKVLAGTPISELPIVYNIKGHLILNLTLADRLGIVFPPSVLKNAEVVE